MDSDTLESNPFSLEKGRGRKALITEEEIFKLIYLKYGCFDTNVKPLMTSQDLVKILNKPEI